MYISGIQSSIAVMIIIHYMPGLCSIRLLVCYMPLHAQLLRKADVVSAPEDGFIQIMSPRGMAPPVSPGRAGTDKEDDDDDELKYLLEPDEVCNVCVCE